MQGGDMSIHKRESQKTHHRGMRRTIIDASGLILGRLASYVAKQILMGEEIVVINAENAVITGSKKSVIAKYQTRLGTRTLGTQKKAPKHPRRPDTYIRRVVRGMLPWKKPKGKSAYRRLKVYISVPEELKGAPAHSFPHARKELRPSMTVGELMTIFGWKNPVEVT
jgi:large subunit ribosomal protein L13